MIKGMMGLTSAGQSYVAVRWSSSTEHQRRPPSFALCRDDFNMQGAIRVGVGGTRGVVVPVLRQGCGPLEAQPEGSQVGAVPRC